MSKGLFTNDVAEGGEGEGVGQKVIFHDKGGREARQYVILHDEGERACRILLSVLLSAAVIGVQPVLIIEVGTHW